MNAERFRRRLAESVSSHTDYVTGRTYNQTKSRVEALATTATITAPTGPSRSSQSPTTLHHNANQNHAGSGSDRTVGLWGVAPHSEQGHREGASAPNSPSVGRVGLEPTAKGL